MRDYPGMQTFDDYLKNECVEADDTVWCQGGGEQFHDWQCQKIGRHYYSNKWLKEQTPDDIMEMYANDPDMRGLITQAKIKATFNG
jgi:hypothetical protein